MFSVKVAICCVRPYCCTVRHININSLIVALLCIRLEENGTMSCLSGYYLNGDICTGMTINFCYQSISFQWRNFNTLLFTNNVYFLECPAGYYGVNCSIHCSPQTYGINCDKECSCSSASCHHVYGCNVIEGL